MWTLAFGHHEDRAPTHGYAETREATDLGREAAKTPTKRPFSISRCGVAGVAVPQMPQGALNVTDLSLRLRCRP
jgi:hypothetical protein